MKTRVRDATLYDLIDVASNLREADRRELALSRDPDDWEQLVMDVVGVLQCKVALVDEQPALAFGARLVSPTTVTVWGFGTDRACLAGRTVTRHVRRTMIPLLRSIGITRAQCAVDVDNQTSRRWLAVLGFAPEALVPGMGDRLLVYARGAE